LTRGFSETLRFGFPRQPRGNALANLLCRDAFQETTDSGAMKTGAQNLVESRETFLSGGKKIEVEIFRPATMPSSPTLLVLHGARGIEFGDAHIRQLAQFLAANGFATFLVHYFDCTNTLYADDASIHQHFELWLETIADAVSFAAQHPGVEAEKIGCFGYSLGGYFALAQAARDSRIRVVIEIAGGVDVSYTDKFQRMPPTLILHGSEDRRVPVSNAHEIERLAKKFGADFEVQIYRGEGHVLSPLAMLDALSRGLAFLQKHLR
jgi:carboxymethylenebutenolidase